LTSQLLNTLYLTTPGAYVHLDNETLRVEVEQETRLRVPLHHLGAVVIFGEVRVSFAAMSALADESKTLVLCDRNGRFKARLEGRTQGNVLLRQAQWRCLEDSAFALDTARAFVAGKLRNCRQVLLRGAREAKSPHDAATLARAAQNLAASLRSLKSADSLDVVRGVEGEAARGYFEALPLLLRADLREDFQMSGRSRRPPLDRFNALLSFLYSLLMNDCRSAAESAGLDPQAGFLHALRPGRAALALDLMEEFRPLLADRIALSLLNRGQLRVGDFDVRSGGAVQLRDDARKTVIVAYQERKQEEVTHTLLDQKGPIGVMPYVQARLLARVLRGDGDGYLPFLSR
jgi:CRISPR-associated protein Cas1